MNYQTKIKTKFEKNGWLMLKLAKTNINGIADFIAFKKDEVPILIECKEKTDTIKPLQIFQNNRLAKKYGFKFQIHQDGKEVINNIEQSNNTDLF